MDRVDSVIWLIACHRTPASLLKISITGLSGLDLKPPQCSPHMRVCYILMERGIE